MKKLIEKHDKLIKHIDDGIAWKDYADKFVQHVFDEYITGNNLTKSEELLLQDLQHCFNIKLINFGLIYLQDEEE